MWILEAFGGGERFRRGDPLRLKKTAQFKFGFMLRNLELL